MQQTDPVNRANISAAQGSRFFNLVQETNTTVKNTSKSLSCLWMHGGQDTMKKGALLCWCDYICMHTFSIVESCSFHFGSPSLSLLFIFEKAYIWKKLLFSIQASVWSEKEDHCMLHHESGKGSKLLYNWIYFHNTDLGTLGYLNSERAPLVSHRARGHPLLILAPVGKEGMKTWERQDRPRSESRRWS